MAQQTINVGTAPNDGTGTPLRTAFQYTNSNFSELYTAVGPSGNNIVVPGNATITGDLTVDTSTLKVDSANNRVGIGTASPVAELHVVGGANFSDGTTTLRAVSAGNVAYLGTTTTDPLVLRVNNIEQYRIAQLGVFNWSDGAGGTRMTLNSTGLGIGTASPATKLHIDTASAGYGLTLAASGLTGRRFQFGINIDANLAIYDTSAAAVRMIIDGSGNVGIGVTPSAWTTSYNALNIGIGGSIAAYKSSLYDQFYIGSNFFENTSGAWRFINNGYATQYWHNSGSHVWRISTTSNAAGANQPLTWTQAMTLDASGNLGIGVQPSAWGSNSKALQVGSGSGAVSSTGAGSTSTRFTHGCYFDNTNWKYQFTGVGPSLYELTGANAGSTHAWYVSAGGTAGNAITFTQAMTLTAGGELLVGKTATNYLTVGCEVKPNGAFQSTQSGSTNANTCWDTYSTGAGAYRFYVGMAGTVFATNTTISAISDARFKENVQDIDVGLGAILALKPRKFDWKDGKGKNIKGDRGFIAQEFETVFPNLIDEWKENAPEGEAPYKSVRQDLIPVLVKAIQELAAEVNALKNA